MKRSEVLSVMGIYIFFYTKDRIQKKCFRLVASYAFR